MSSAIDKLREQITRRNAELGREAQQLATTIKMHAMSIHSAGLAAQYAEAVHRQDETRLILRDLEFFAGEEEKKS